MAGTLPSKVWANMSLISSHLAAGRRANYGLAAHPALTASRQKLLWSHKIDARPGRNDMGAGEGNGA